MNSKCMLALLATLAPLTLATACAKSPEPVSNRSVAAITAHSPSPAAAASPAIAAPAKVQQMVVHKSPTCGCCGAWVDHMRAAGFQVEVRETDNLHPIKERVGVPLGKGSCHTAEIGGYFIEGHVPAEDVKRLLAHKPDAKGLVVPGMPAGSPGMELPDGRTEPYTVELVHRDGSTGVFATH
ncbi:MAG TPA: DUF411 domain-containing protein [Xanthomonadaceae bacterium]|nr:DUF411 domain-containing protein [Xanthomonadaceae bacterium]